MPTLRQNSEGIVDMLQQLAEQLHLEAAIMPPSGQEYAQQLARRTQEIATRIRKDEHSHSNGREFGVICHLIDDGIMISPRDAFNKLYLEVNKAFRKWDADFFSALHASPESPK